MNRPKNLPKWASDKTRPYGDNEGTIDQLEKNGFVAGDFPKSDDINRIGWDLETWATYLDEKNTASSSNIESIKDIFVRRSLGVGGNYPPPAPAVINTNDLIDKKVSAMEDNINPIFQSTSETDYNALEELQKNLNTRINRKVTAAFEATKTSVESFCPDLISATVAEAGSTDGEESKSLIQIENERCTFAKFDTSDNSFDWTDTIVKTINSTPMIFIDGSSTTSGVPMMFPQDPGLQNIYGFASSISLDTLPTVHIFAVVQGNMKIGIIADINKQGINAVAKYKEYTNLKDDVYIRRLATLKVINTKARGSAESDNYRFMQMQQRGDNAIYSVELRPRDTIIDANTLELWIAPNNTTINATTLVPDGFTYKYRIFALNNETYDTTLKIWTKGAQAHYSRQFIQSHMQSEICTIEDSSKTFTFTNLLSVSTGYGIMPIGHYDKRID